MKVDCSKTLVYLQEKTRLCKSIGSCGDCPLNKGKGSCNNAKGADAALKLINAVQQWSDKHPQKTYRDDFFEKFPKAPKDEDGYPVCMPCEIYSSQSDVSCVICGECEKFWDEAYEE